jgi:acyl carrier protein
MVNPDRRKVLDPSSPSGAAAEPGKDLRSRIYDVIAREAMVDRGKLVPDATLESLGMSSMDVVQILLGIEDEFGVYIPVNDDIAASRNLGELETVVSKLILEGQGRPG